MLSLVTGSFPGGLILLPTIMMDEVVRTIEGQRTKARKIAVEGLKSAKPKKTVSKRVSVSSVSKPRRKSAVKKKVKHG